MGHYGGVGHVGWGRMGRVMQEWGGVGHVGVGWGMQRWGGVGHAGVEWVMQGRVGHSGVNV